MPEQYVSGIMGRKAQQIAPPPRVDKKPTMREAHGFTILKGDRPAGRKRGGWRNEKTKALMDAIKGLAPGEWFRWDHKMKTPASTLSVIRKRLKEARHPAADVDWEKPLSGDNVLIVFRPGGEAEEAEV